MHLFPWEPPDRAGGYPGHSMSLAYDLHARSRAAHRSVIFPRLLKGAPGTPSPLITKSLPCLCLYPSPEKLDARAADSLCHPLSSRNEPGIDEPPPHPTPLFLPCQ